MSHIVHQELSKHLSANYAILTISDTRDTQTDKSGQLLQSMLNEAGHKLINYRICKDDTAVIKTIVSDLLNLDRIDLVITTGGTGISNRDNTIPVICEFIKQKIDGFGELFRMLSYQEIGSSAMLSRAVGGKHNNTVIFALPGSANAVKLAMEKLIIPQIPHLIYESNK